MIEDRSAALVARKEACRIEEEFARSAAVRAGSQFRSFARGYWKRCLLDLPRRPGLIARRRSSSSKNSFRLLRYDRDGRLEIVSN